MEGLRTQLKFFEPTARFLADKDFGASMRNSWRGIYGIGFRTNLEKLFKLADEFLPSMPGELNAEYLRYKNRGLVKMDTSTAIDMRKYPYHIQINENESTALGLVGLCHELTHSITNDASELAPRVSDYMAESVLRDNYVVGFSSGKRYDDYVRSDIGVLNYDILNAFEMGATNHKDITNGRYYFGSIGSIPVIEKIEGGEMTWEKAFEIGQKDMVAKLKSFGVTGASMKASVERFLRM